MRMENFDVILMVVIFATPAACTYLLGLWRGRRDYTRLRWELEDARRRADTAQEIAHAMTEAAHPAHSTDPADIARLMADHTERILDGMTDVAKVMLPDYTTTVTGGGALDDDEDDLDASADYIYTDDPRGDFADWPDVAPEPGRVTPETRMARAAGITPPVEPDVDIDDWTV